MFKQHWIALSFLLLAFSISILNKTVQAQTISYPAQLEGCAFNALNYFNSRSTCSASAYFVLRNSWTPHIFNSALCVPDLVNVFQSIGCTFSGLHSENEIPWSVFDNYLGAPIYTCLYGRNGNWPQGAYNSNGIAYNSASFICEISTNNTNIILTKNLGKSCELVGHPIHAGTGNKYLEESDYDFTSLKFIRNYNSQQSRLNQHIGIQWCHSYSKRLVFNLNGSDSVAFAEREDGSTLFFTLNNNLWVSDGDVSAQLTELQNGNWQFVLNDDTIEIYDTGGQLQVLTTRDGRTQTLSYDANGHLATVSDDTGRSLMFTYDGSARIATLTDPAGGLYQYGYSTNGNLTSVTYPDNTVRTYHYNEPAYTSNTNLPNALTGITDEKGVRYATYTYDVSGRAIITEHAGGADKHTLTYSTDGSNTITIDPLGSQYTRQFQTILGVTKTVSQSQPAGSGCNAASSAMTYDVNGNVSSRADFNSNKTCYAYDLTRNLEIARIESLSASSSCPVDVVNYYPAANSSARKILTGWHANFRLPTLVTEAQRETTIAYDTYGNVTQLSLRDTATNQTRAGVRAIPVH